MDELKCLKYNEIGDMWIENRTFIYVFGNHRDGLKLIATSDLWMSFIEHMHSFIMRML